MAKVRAPAGRDFTGTRYGVAFVRGVGETDDERALHWFRQHGYEVEEAEPESKPLNKWKVAELHELAEDLGIEGHSELTKEPLLEAIEAHYAAMDEGGDAAQGDGGGEVDNGSD